MVTLQRLDQLQVLLALHGVGVELQCLDQVCACLVYVALVVTDGMSSKGEDQAFHGELTLQAHMRNTMNRLTVWCVAADC